MRWYLVLILSACAPAQQWRPVSALPTRTMEGGKAGAVVLENFMAIRYDARPSVFQTSMAQHLLIEVTGEAGINQANVRVPFLAREIHGRVIGNHGDVTELKDAEILREVDGQETILRMPRVSIGSRIELDIRLAVKSIAMALAQAVSLAAPTQHYRLDMWSSDSIKNAMKAYNFRQEPSVSHEHALEHVVFDLRDIRANSTTEFAPPWQLTEPWWGYHVLGVDFAGSRPGVDTWDSAFSEELEAVHALNDKSPAFAHAEWKNLGERARTVQALAWVQQATTFSGFVGALSAARALAIVANDGTANNIEKALLLQRVLTDNGIEAELAFTGRDRGLFFDSYFPLLKRFDHVLVWLPAQGDLTETSFVDPSCEACGFGQVPDWSGGRMAAIMSSRFDTFATKTKPEMHFEAVRGKSPSPNRRVHFADATVAANGAVTVHKTYTLTGTPAVEAMIGEGKTPTSPNHIPSAFETLAPSVSLTQASALKCQRDKAHCELTAEFSVPGFAPTASVKWQVPLDTGSAAHLEKALHERKADLYFGHSETEDLTSTFHLPAGYSAVHLPEGVAAESPALSVRVAIKQQTDPTGNLLIVHQTITRNAGRYKTADYAAAQGALARAVALRSEVFTLERAR